MKGEIEDIAGHAARFLKETNKKRERKNADKSKFLYGEKGCYSYFGVSYLGGFLDFFISLHSYA